MNAVGLCADGVDAGTGGLLPDTYARTATEALLPDLEPAHRTGALRDELSAAASLTALGRRRSAP